MEPEHLEGEVKESTDDVLHLARRTLPAASTVLEDGNQIYHLAGSRVCGLHSVTDPVDF